MVGLPEPPGRSAAGPERREMERLLPHTTRTVSGVENAGKNKFEQSESIIKVKKQIDKLSIY